MKLKISIDPSTTNSELVHLGNFLTALGMNRGAHVISAPIDEAELDEPEPTCIPLNREEPVAHVEVTPAGAVLKRKRRTKAEIAAAAEAEERAQHAYDHARNQPDSEAEAAAPTDPAPTPPVEPPATPPSETASTEPASASPSDRPVPTTGALNQKAAIVAKKHGPAMVKEKIISLGSTLISLLNDEGKIALDAWLDEQA